MVEFFQDDSFRNTFLAGFVIALVAPTIGIFFVVRRYSIMADTIAHLSLVGVAVGLIAGFASIPAAFVFSVLSVLGIEWMREKRTLPSDTIVSLFLFGGLALAVVLLGFAGGQGEEQIEEILFGSIETVAGNDLFLIVIMGTLSLLVTALCWRMFFASSVDEETAEATGLPVRALNRTLVVLGAAAIAISLKVVGLLLIGALMVVPVLAGMKLGVGFFRTWLAAVILSVVSVLAGLLLSSAFGFEPGGTIVLMAIVGFIVCSVLGRFFQKKIVMQKFSA